VRRSPAPRSGDEQTGTSDPPAQHRYTELSIDRPDRDRDPVPESSLDPDALMDRATAGPAEPLPYRELLERRLGRSLEHVEAHFGPRATSALSLLRARAATRGNQVVFAEDHPDLATVTHEVAHVLQASPSPAGQANGLVDAHSDAEEAANTVVRDVDPDRGYDGGELVVIQGRLPEGSMALQRTAAVAEPEAGTTVLERPREPALPTPQPAGEPAAPTVAPEEEPQAALERERSRDPGAEAPSEASPQLQLGPPPEPGVTAEDVAAREAALAEAEAILAGAQDVNALIGGFASVPPTLKARQQGQLGQQVNSLAQEEAQTYESELPDLHASLDAQVEPVEPVVVEASVAETVTLEAAPPAPMPEPDIPETPDPGQFTANAGVTRVIDQRFGGDDPAVRAEQVDASLQEVQTTDPDIPRSPGPAPVVPLAGETDPERLPDQAAQGIDGARGARDSAQAAVVNGPGPELVQPAQMDEAYPVEGLNTPTIEPPAPVEGADAYLAMELAPEVQTAFDQQQQEQMQASMADAVAQTEQAAADRDQARQTQVEAATTQAAELSRQADEEQRSHVLAARDTIQTERQATIDAQTAAVADMEVEVEARRDVDRQEIDDRVTADQEQIATSYTQAETDVSTEIEEGEREAAAEKAQTERDAEEESWWDQAISFVREAFSALVAAIGTIFDRVRSAVNGILDAARAFATQLIDAAAGFIKDAIAAYGAFLQGAVDALLGDVFPGLAAALNSAIDGAVGLARDLVDAAADGLKAGVNALVEGLRAGLNAVLDVYQAAIGMALAVVQAVLTGDWSALARKVLEAVLKVAGIDPESFYAFIGRAQETFQIIIDSPGTFLGHLVDAFLGGVQQFATNFLTHLQAGIIGWLTGTLGSAGITLPPRFDLWGVLDLARQILGLTWERLRARAVVLIGEQNVARLEVIGSYIQTLVTEGWSGLWQRIQGDLGGLLDRVLDGIKSFLLERVVLAAITKLASLFSPVGALVQLVLTAWNLFTFLRDQLQRIYAVVQTVVDAIGDIARGILAGAITKVEQVLASLLPLALDLLARLLGLGNVGARVREIVEGIRETVDRAIDGLIERVLSAFRGGGGAAPAPDGAAAGPAAAAPTAAGTIEETFRVAGEPHTLRAVPTDGQFALVMASNGFAEMTQRMHQLLENLRTIYTRPGGHLHGTPQAKQLEAEFTAIEDAAIALFQAVQAETDPARERQVADAGLERLRAMFTALALPEAAPPAPAIPPGHATRNQLYDGIRAEWFEVNPLSELSLGQGGAAAGSIPGGTILIGLHTYDRGHLVANSVGGPGNATNLVPMSHETNKTNIGMRRIERDLYDALLKTRGNTEAAPPYIFSYQVTAEYRTEGGLETEMQERAGAAPGSEARLLALAAPGNRFGDTRLIAALQNPALTSLAAPARDALAANVRRRLAWHYMPSRFLVDAQIIQQPEREDMRTTISSSQPVTNHLGISLSWSE
jgi:hypothetical protein